MKDLHAIVYVSSATRSLTHAELDDLLARARRRNEDEDITGFLLFCDGNFMQYIEGPREALERVYALICQDPTHRNILELLNEPVSVREFSGWSMAYAPAQMREFTALSGAPWKDLAAARDPHAVQGRMMLREFWLQHRKNGL